MSAYYNENDPKTAAWLRELIKADLIANGEVDERSIVDVQAGDLRGFVQCHFFAGIGGWSYALRLAGWPDDRPVWTGSCPCQPFSSAGAQIGGHDSRDLWPAWFQLVKECRPHVVFGEQVEAAINHGWLDRLCDDLEAEGYAVGPVGLPSASIGAFHIRQRLWFVADTERHDNRGEINSADHWAPQAYGSTDWVGGRGCASVDLADTDVALASDGGLQRSGRLVQSKKDTVAGVVADSEGEGRQRLSTEAWPEIFHRARRREVGEFGDTGSAGSRRHAGAVSQAEAEGSSDRIDARDLADEPEPTGFWSNAEWILCRDGKWRPVEPGSFPLAHGLPARVGRLRGYGNAIVPQVAAEVIRAYMEIADF